MAQKPDSRLSTDASGQYSTAISDTFNYTQTYPIEYCGLTNVEHPCLVRNVGKVVDTMGGASRIAEIVRPDQSYREADLYLRNDDPLAGHLPSASIPTDNLLLQISIPRLTGRKRKRGSNGPFQDSSCLKTTSGRASEDESTVSGINVARKSNSREMGLPDRLYHASNRFEVAVIGPIERTHRFRTIPDFVYSTAKQSFMSHVRDTIIPMKYETAKGFCLDPSKGVKQNTELIPPPQWSHFHMPFNYSYHQNPAVRQVLSETGNVTVKNDQTPRRVWTERVLYNVEQVPKEPDKGVVPLETLDAPVQQLVQQMRSLLDERPIWTRRALENQLTGNNIRNMIKHAYHYLGYTFRSGPWRDAIIKYGVDPRSDPKYRIYQTMMFQLDEDKGAGLQRKERKRRGGARRPRLDMPRNDGGLGRMSHIFDGITVGSDGKVWQVCDITDPLLSSILQTSNVRRECHIRCDGWFHNGTWAKARVIAKTKIATLKNKGEVIKDKAFSRLVAIPEKLNRDTMPDAYMPRQVSTAAEMDMATIIRSMASTPTPDEEQAESKAGDKSAVNHRDGSAINRLSLELTNSESSDTEDEDEEEEDDDDDDDEEKIEEEESEIYGEGYSEGPTFSNLLQAQFGGMLADI